MAPKTLENSSLCEGYPFITVTSQKKEEIKEVETESKPEKELCQILDAIGIWGPWHLKRCLVILVIIWLPASFHLLNMVFYRAETDFWCTRPDKFSNWSVSDWRDLSQPGWRNSSDAACHVRNYDYDQVLVDPPITPSSPLLLDPLVPLLPCQDWQFDTSFWQKTIIMDFQLVCDRHHLRKLQQQVTFLGLMCGVAASGYISDRMGRRRTMVVLLLCNIIAGTATSFSPNYPCFLLGILICAFMALGYGTVMYVWMMEHVGGRYKTILGAMPHYNFGFWGLMTALLAYMMPNWRSLQLIFSLPLLLLLPAYWVLPESSRWLLANGRVQEAEAIVRTIAEANSRPLPPNFQLQPPATPTPSSSSSSLTTFLRLFSQPNMRRKTLICYYLWFSTALIYYGLTLNSNTIGTDLFVTFCIGKALEFPSITVVIILLLKTGRRSSLMLFYSLAGVSLSLTMFIPLGYFTYEWPILVLNLLGRMSAINTLCVCYIYSAEVFPTLVRNIGLGSSSFWARVGPMIAPFIVDLRVYGDTVPLGVFGAVALVAALLVTFMPETSNTPLPDTVEDGEMLGVGDNFWSSCRQKKKTRSCTS